jgi:hypothetical protein
MELGKWGNRTVTGTRHAEWQECLGQSAPFRPFRGEESSGSTLENFQTEISLKGASASSLEFAIGSCRKLNESTPMTLQAERQACQQEKMVLLA